MPCLWTHGGMMARATPLLLLLPLLLMGSQEQGFQVKYKEGQTLKVSCSYNPQISKEKGKTWCKLRENGKVCDRLITRNSMFTKQYRDRQASLKDDIYTGTIIITMVNLTLEDSGNYQCGIYDSVNNTIDVIETIRLEVSSATASRTTKHPQTTTKTPLANPAIPWATNSSLVLQVLCGLIVTKGLVFIALIVLLGRCRGPGKGRSQSELSQGQNEVK